MQLLTDRSYPPLGRGVARRLAVLAWVLVCACGGASTGSTTVTEEGSLTVSVKDTAGGYVSGATIEASLGTSAARVATTDARGVATLSALSPGTYLVTVSGSAVSSFRPSKSIAITANAGATLDFVMPTPIGGSWRTEPSLREARASVATVATASAIFLIGGSSSSRTLDVDRFDGTAWTRETAIDAGLNAPAAALLGDEIFVIGGFEGIGNVPSRRVRAYNLITKTWRDRAPLPTLRGGIQAAVLNGKIHIIGGGNEVSTLNAHEAYDPVQDRWVTLSPLPSARGNPALAVLDGKIFAIGGAANGAAFTNVDIYDPVTDRWAAGPAISPARGAARAVVYHNALYVFGGENATGVLTEVNRLNASGSAWETVTPMLTGRSYAGSAVFGDAVYIVGGSSRAPTSHGSVGVPTVERFFIR